MAYLFFNLLARLIINRILLYRLRQSFVTYMAISKTYL